MIRFRLFFMLFISQFGLQGHTQVDQSFRLDYGFFLSSYTKNKVQWVCGMEISALDSTNSRLKVRFELLKDWVIQDSLICTLTLDSSQIFVKNFHDKEENTLRYYSNETNVVIYLCVPAKYEYVLPNGMSGISYQFHHAGVDLPKKWKKHQKKFDCFFEK